MVSLTLILTLSLPLNAHVRQFIENLIVVVNVLKRTRTRLYVA